MKIYVLGANGMLGHKVVQQAEKLNLEVIAATRDGSLMGNTPGVKKIKFDALADKIMTTELAGLNTGDFVINCMGIIKTRLARNLDRDNLEAIHVNARFPLELASMAEQQGFRVLQIATDCVFSGHRGGYTEADSHDALDVYGKTKSLGESTSRQVLNIRCSIIGPEISNRTSLQEWFLNQPAQAIVPGFTNHFWNGVSTKVFAKLALGLAVSQSDLHGTQHFVPKDSVSKLQLLQLIAEKHDRKDIRIQPTETKLSIDRTLATVNGDLNERLWELAGFDAVPLIANII